MKELTTLEEHVAARQIDTAGTQDPVEASVKIFSDSQTVLKAMKAGKFSKENEAHWPRHHHFLRGVEGEISSTRVQAEGGLSCSLDTWSRCLIPPARGSGQAVPQVRTG